MAATVNTPAPKVQLTEKPTEVLFKLFTPKGKDKTPENAKPVITVAPQGNEFAGLSGGIPKWARLFGLDKDGDHVLAEVWKLMYQQADETGKEELVQSIRDMVESINGFLGNTTEETAKS